MKQKGELFMKNVLQTQHPLLFHLQRDRKLGHGQEQGGETIMQNHTNRTCPACGSTEYAFRSRKKLPPEPGEKEAVETKYRCKACEHK